MTTETGKRRAEPSKTIPPARPIDKIVPGDPTRSWIASGGNGQAAWHVGVSQRRGLRVSAPATTITFKISGVVLLRNLCEGPEFCVYKSRADAAVDYRLGRITPYDYGLVIGAFDRRERNAGCGCGCKEAKSEESQKLLISEPMSETGGAVEAAADGCVTSITISAGTSQSGASQAALSFESNCKSRVCPTGSCGAMIRDPVTAVMMTVNQYVKTVGTITSASVIVECDCNPGATTG